MNGRDYGWLSLSSEGPFTSAPLTDTLLLYLDNFSEVPIKASSLTLQSSTAQSGQD